MNDEWTILTDARWAASLEVLTEIVRERYGHASPCRKYFNWADDTPLDARPLETCESYHSLSFQNYFGASHELKVWFSLGSAKTTVWELDSPLPSDPQFKLRQRRNELTRAYFVSLLLEAGAESAGRGVDGEVVNWTNGEGAALTRLKNSHNLHRMTARGPSGTLHAFGATFGDEDLPCDITASAVLPPLPNADKPAGAKSSDTPERTARLEKFIAHIVGIKYELAKLVQDMMDNEEISDKYTEAANDIYFDIGVKLKEAMGESPDGN